MQGGGSDKAWLGFQKVDEVATHKTKHVIYKRHATTPPHGSETCADTCEGPVEGEASCVCFEMVKSKTNFPSFRCCPMGQSPIASFQIIMSLLEKTTLPPNHTQPDAVHTRTATKS